MIKKYEMATGTFYLQEIPILDKPSPFNSISLTTREVDFSKDIINDIIEEDDYTIERYTENGIAKVIIKFQKDENGRGLIIMMDEEDMEKNGFKIKTPYKEPEYNLDDVAKTLEISNTPNEHGEVLYVYNNIHPQF